VGLQAADSRDNAFIGTITLPILAACIVQPPRAIYTQPHIKVSICQKRAPVIIEKSAIGLEIVPASPPLGEVAFLQFHGMSVEVKSGQCWFATMPYKLDNRPRAGRYILMDVRLKQAVRHSELMWTCVEALGLQIIAVIALQVADRTDRFGHDNERFGTRCPRPRDFLWHTSYLSSDTSVSNIVAIQRNSLFPTLPA
jgi:hypothetical protein